MVAERIAGLRFAPAGSLITVSLDFELPDRVSADPKRTISRVIVLRN